MRHVTLAKGTPLNAYSETYPSANGVDRKTRKWTKLSQAREALDDKGHVILDKALAVFEEYKDITAKFVRVGERLQYPELRPGFDR